jgi:broad specificity phosphatase PhoE
MDRLDARARSTAVIIAHGNSGIVIVQWWLRLSEESRHGISFDLDPASITHLRINEYGERTIARLNCTCHL